MNAKLLQGDFDIKHENSVIKVLILLFCLIIMTFFILSRHNFASIDQNKSEYYVDSNGEQFLYGGADAYYFFRLARNLAEYGMLGDTIEHSGDGNNITKDSLRMFPAKDIPPNSIFPHVLFYFFKVWKIFIPTISLIRTTTYFPVFTGILSVLLLFFITKKISDEWGGFLAAYILAVHPIFLYGNYVGYADTHVFAQFWSLATILCLFYAMDWQKKAKAIIAGVILLFLLFYAKLVWPGLVFVHLLFIIFFVILFTRFFIDKIITRNKTQVIIIFCAIIITFAATYFFYSDFIGSAILMLIQKPQNFIPNAFPFIDELQGAKTVLQFLSYLGGFFILSFLAGTIYSIRHSIKPQKNKLIFVFIWFAILVLPALNASRILFFLLPPFAIISGIGLRFYAELLWHKLQKYGLKFSPQTARIAIILCMILFIFLLSNPFTIEMKPASVTRSLNDASQFILAHSSSDAVIATWWDLGYAWQALSKRATFFDGGLFNTPRLYWMSKALYTENETMAANSLRLMSCDSDKYLYGLFKTWVRDSPNKMLLFNKILELDSQKDANILANKMCISFKSVLCGKNSEIFLAVTEEMIYQIPFFEYYSNWNFRDIYVSSAIKNLSETDAVAELESSFNLSHNDALSFYIKTTTNIGKIKPAIIDNLSKCKDYGSKIVCDNGAIVELMPLSVKVKGLSPKSFVLVKDQKTTKINYDNSTMDFSVAVYNTAENEYNSIVMADELMKKMVMRMFLGEKIDNFEKVFISGETPQRIAVYKLLPAKEPAITPFLEKYNLSERYFFVPQNYRGKSIILINTTTRKINFDIPFSAKYVVVNFHDKKSATGSGVLQVQEIYYYDENKKMVKQESIDANLVIGHILITLGNSLCSLY